MVKIWRVILAAVVIFAAGGVTGGLITHLMVQGNDDRRPGKQRGFSPKHRTEHYVERMTRELGLTDTQRAKIEQIFAESHERMKPVWETAVQEHRKVQQQIRAELTPAQAEKFDELFSGPPGHGKRHGHGKDGEGSGGGPGKKGERENGC